MLEYRRQNRRSDPSHNETMTELSPTLFQLDQVLSFEQSLLLTCQLTSCGKLGVAIIKGVNGSVHLITISLKVRFDLYTNIKKTAGYNFL